VPITPESDIDFMARVLREHRPAPDGTLEGVNAHYQWQAMVRGFAAAIQKFHPRSFDRNAFYRAAGYPRPTN
jgi:hypothetical protein